ncbi:MAG: hypothetical protein Q7U10_01720 [Thermodesulfovibrionia bacterium]|nr:hypothetical protein [Thermodesulfovibrionia bacterium]
MLHYLNPVRTILFIFIFLIISSNAYAFDIKAYDLYANINISSMYDDNITLDAAENTIYKDNLTKLGLELGFRYEGKNRTLTVSGNIWQSLYSKYDAFNDLTGDITLDFTNHFTEYDWIRVKNAYFNKFVADTFVDAFGQPQGRNKYYSNDFNLSYNKHISSQISAIATYQNGFWKNIDSGDSGIISSNTDRVSVAADYMHSAATTYTSYYEFSKTAYEGTDTEISGHIIGVGVKQHITKQLFFHGLGGANFTDKVIKGKEVSGLGGYMKVMATNEFKNTFLQVSIEKRKQANTSREELFDFWESRIAITRQISANLSSSLLGFYGHGRFESSDISEDLLGTDINLTYIFSKNIKGIMSYAHSEKETTESGQSLVYTKNTILAGLTVGF